MSTPKLPRAAPSLSGQVFYNPDDRFLRFFLEGEGKKARVSHLVPTPRMAPIRVKWFPYANLKDILPD